MMAMKGLWMRMIRRKRGSHSISEGCGPVLVSLSLDRQVGRGLLFGIREAPKAILAQDYWIEFYWTCPGRADERSNCRLKQGCADDMRIDRVVRSSRHFTLFIGIAIFVRHRCNIRR